MAENTSELAVVAQESNLPTNKVEELLSNFGDSFKLAKQVSAGATDIVVTEETQTELMGAARSKRLELKNIRIEVEKTRKSLKEQSLREGKAIDGMANIIKALIIPIEEHLEIQEKFAERAEAERKHKRHLDRIEKLSKFVDNVNIYSLEDMSEDDFTTLLRQAEDAYKAKKEAERQAAIERQKAVEAEEKRQQEQAAENARLKKEAEKREIERAKERAAAEAKLAAEKKASEEKLAKERAKAEAIKKAKDEELRIEREKRAEMERIKAQEEAAAAKAKAAQEEAERQALLAPDKQKLITFAQAIDTIRLTKLPAVKSNDAQKIVNETELKLSQLFNYLMDSAKKL